jgi:hypothetical protein
LEIGNQNITEYTRMRMKRTIDINSSKMLMIELMLLTRRNLHGKLV